MKPLHLLIVAASALAALTVGLTAPDAGSVQAAFSQARITLPGLPQS